jgi:hypothetical protein
VLDEYGNVVDDRGTDVWIFESCGTFRDSITVIGTVPLEVVVTGATGDECAENQLSVSGGASGLSGFFDTLPGSASELRILASADTAVAGAPYPAVVWAEDDYGNTLQEFVGELNLTDSEGSLDTTSCEEGAVRFCTLTFINAVSSTVILADDGIDATGSSEPIVVVAGPAVELVVTGLPDSLVAGVETEITATISDPYGNAIAIDASGADPFEDQHGSDANVCQWLGETDLGVHELACTFTAASEAVAFVLSLPSLALSADAIDLEVINGPLAQVDVSTDVSTIGAGDAFNVEITASDEFGNAYVVKTDADLDLADEALTLAPQVLQIGEDGTASGPFTIDRAGSPITVNISQAGITLASFDITVQAGEADHLSVELDGAWTWLDKSLSVRVTARDNYGNAVPDFSSVVVLSSGQDAFTSSALPSFADGTSTSQLTWNEAVLQDTVIAIAEEGLLGTSDPVDVLDANCAEAPTAVLTLDGQSEAVVCRVSVSATVTADFSQSTGASEIVAYHLDDGQGGLQRLTDVSVDLETDQEGGWTATLVVVDSDACGDETSAIWWAGDADLDPVGPIIVSGSHTTRTAGSSTNGTTTVQLAGTTCSGDLAAGGTLYARVDLGILQGLTAVGSGLAVTLDSLGEGSLTWSVETETHAGTATLDTGTGNGASWGTVSMAVTGDSARPTVVSVDPSGSTAELLSEVVVVFTEPMNSSTVSDLTIALDGPDGTEIISTYGLDEFGTELTLTLDSQLDANAGEWVLTIDSAARDDAGNNRLDGTWSGSSSNYTGIFGNVVDDAITVSGCIVDSQVLIPDGDDGAGDEADSVTVTATSSQGPIWWALQVLDNDGQAVRTFRQAGSGTATTLTWDGRTDDGFVAGVGVYILAVSTFDAQDNQSTGCENQVTLEQHFGDPG